jgi:hypothetical protein
MPLEALAEGLLKGIFRFMAHIVIEVLFELAIKGPGYFLAKRITGNEQNVDGWKVVILGLLFWLMIGTLGYYVYSSFYSAG